MSSSDAYPVPPVNKNGIYQAEYTGGPAAAQPDSAGAASSGKAEATPKSPEFSVDSDGVRAQAAIIAQCGDRAAQVLDKLRGTLEAAGMPWGTDELGQAFGKKYPGAANQGFASIAALPAALVNVANELASQADTYDAIEQQITNVIHKIGQPGTGSGVGPS